MYEVLRRTNGSTTTWRRNSEPDVTPPGDSDDPIRVDRPRPTAAGPGLFESIKRWLHSASGRLHLSLTYPLLAGVAVGVIVLVWLAFATGRRVGERATVQTGAQDEPRKDNSVSGVLGLADELGKNRAPQHVPAPAPDPKKETSKAPEKPKDVAKPPAEKPLTPEKPKSQATQIVANPGAEPAAEPAVKKDDKDAKRAKEEKSSTSSTEVEKSYQLEANKHYIQVQCFPKGHDGEARSAAEYLEQNGIPVAIFFRARDIVVYVREPFTIKNADAAAAKAERARAEDWKKRVKAAGLQYTKQGGRYDFKLADLELPSR